MSAGRVLEREAPKSTSPNRFFTGGHICIEGETCASALYRLPKISQKKKFETKKVYQHKLLLSSRISNFLTSCLVLVEESTNLKLILNKKK